MIAQRSSPALIMVGIVGSLSLVALAYLLWPAPGGGLLRVAPEYWNSVAWLVVMPIWLLSPAFAALLWARLTQSAARAAALISASTIGATFAFLVWNSFDPAACQTSPRTPEQGLIGLSIALGLLVGIGWANSGFIGRSAFVAGKPWRALAGAVTFAIGHLVLVLLVFTVVVLMSGGCNRPGT